LGLVSAALLAFNPCVLAGAQEPLPQSPAAMLAMLSLAGLIAHWQKSATVTSYQLLLGGIALGGCLLAGGPVALAVVLSVVLYILWWKLDARFRRRAGLVRDRSEFHRRTAFRSAGILLATGFAVGGWYLLLMSSRHGRLFWQAWINIAATGPATSRSASGPVSFFECIRELNQLALPFLGLAFLGFIGIVRDWYRGDEDSLRQYRGILPVWTAVAFVAWILSGAAGRSGRSDAALWDTMLTVPLVIAAAVGLIEVIERRVGFLAALAVGLLTLADAAILTGQSLSESGESLMTWLPGLSAKASGVGILMVLGVCGIALFRFAGRNDIRRRIVLTGLLLVVVTVSAVWGALAVRRTNQGDSELDAMRAAAARLSGVANCTFVWLAPRDGEDALLPPAQLTFLLASLWPGAEIRYMNFWDDAVAKSVGGPPPDETPLEVFAAWSPRGRVRGSPPSAGLRSAAPPFHFRDVEMVLYVRDLGSRAAGE
jgi:4-amino-4-deoxy-L-arabinose transferase-like glycosyltransferase